MELITFLYICHILADIEKCDKIEKYCLQLNEEETNVVKDILKRNFATILNFSS